MLKYKGQFRIKADYDLGTNDFVRDENGKLDSSFDDFYIPCDKSGKIRHYQKKILYYYCPSIGRFKNILKSIYDKYIQNVYTLQTTTTLPSGKTKTTFDYDTMFKELLNTGTLEFINDFEEEGEFGFKTEQMEYIASLVGAKTSGANISPFSTKNLPSIKYTIPSEEMAKYKEIIGNIDKKNMNLISKFTTDFDKIIQNKMGKKHNLSYERKLSCLGNKEFIHYIGLFSEYLDFLKTNVLHYQTNNIH